MLSQVRCRPAERVREKERERETERENQNRIRNGKSERERGNWRERERERRRETEKRRERIRGRERERKRENWRERIRTESETERESEREGERQRKRERGNWRERIRTESETEREKETEVPTVSSSVSTGEAQLNKELDRLRRLPSNCVCPNCAAEDEQGLSLFLILSVTPSHPYSLCLSSFKMCSHADSLSLCLIRILLFIKGTQDFKMCSHADSLDSLSHPYSLSYPLSSCLSLNVR
jgi:hypothetical protein